MQAWCALCYKIIATVCSEPAVTSPVKWLLVRRRPAAVFKMTLKIHDKTAISRGVKLAVTCSVFVMINCDKLEKI